jgi:hypothetical protein
LVQSAYCHAKFLQEAEKVRKLEMLPWRCPHRRESSAV